MQLLRSFRRCCINSSPRSYCYFSTSIKQSPMLDSTTNSTNNKATNTEILLSTARARVQYNHALKETRKRYAEEVAAIRLAEEAQRQRVQEELTRQKRERQRLKLLKSIESAKKQLRLHQQRKTQWEEELRHTQIQRQKKQERFHKARLLILQELEEEAKHWVATTPDEVNHVFVTNERHTSQQLWARPHSRIGVAPPDATFWRYQADTWNMSKTYQTPREVLFQQMQEQMDYQANIDEDNYWSPERQMQQLQKEERARLRALIERQTTLQLVHQQLQREATGSSTYSSDKHKLIVAQVQYRKSNKNIPPDHPLRDALAKAQHLPTDFHEMERQVALSKDNFFKFFVLEEQTGQIHVKPHESWPVLLGRDEPYDTRLDKEKKRDKKEEQTLWAQMGGNEAADAEEDDDAEEEDDEDRASGEDDDEENNRLALSDPVLREFVQGPEEYKLSEKDVDWMIEKLEKQVMLLEDDIQSQMTTARSSTATTISTTTTTSAKGFNENDVNYIKAMGIVDGLTEEQQDAICALEDIEFNGEQDVPKLMELLHTVDGLSGEQVQAIVDVEMAHFKDATSIT